MHSFFFCPHTLWVYTMVSGRRGGNCDLNPPFSLEVSGSSPKWLCHFEKCFLTSPGMSNYIISQGGAVWGIGKISKCLMTCVSWCMVRIQHGHRDSKPSLVAGEALKVAAWGRDSPTEVH